MRQVIECRINIIQGANRQEVQRCSQLYPYPVATWCTMLHQLGGAPWFSVLQGLAYIPSTDTFLALRESFSDDGRRLMPITRVSLSYCLFILYLYLVCVSLG